MVWMWWVVAHLRRLRQARAEKARLEAQQQHLEEAAAAAVAMVETPHLPWSS